jgi:tRNA (cmo5U34)-methyltransferase
MSNAVSCSGRRPITDDEMVDLVESHGGRTEAAGGTESVRTDSAGSAHPRRQGTGVPSTFGAMAGQWHFDADTYLAMVRAEIPAYDRLQDLTAEATADLDARTILDLGSGTGLTATCVLARHPRAELTGVDMSPDMLAHANLAVPEAMFVEGRLEDPLPVGPFDLVVSAFAVHHLSSDGKAALFPRVFAALRPGGRFVLCDVVVPTAPVPVPVPLEVGVDLPDTVAAQLAWLRDAGFTASVTYENGDLAVLRADRP